MDYVSNRALVWLAFETCEVVSAKRQSTDGQIEPNRQAGCKPRFFLLKCFQSLDTLTMLSFKLNTKLLSVID